MAAADNSKKSPPRPRSRRTLRAANFTLPLSRRCRRGPSSASGAWKGQDVQEKASHRRALCLSYSNKLFPPPSPSLSALFFPPCSGACRRRTTTAANFHDKRLCNSLSFPLSNSHDLPMFALLDREKLGSLHMPGASSSSVGTSGNASLQLSSAIVFSVAFGSVEEEKKCRSKAGTALFFDLGCKRKEELARARFRRASRAQERFVGALARGRLVGTSKCKAVSLSRGGGRRRPRDQFFDRKAQGEEEGEKMNAGRSFLVGDTVKKPFTSPFYLFLFLLSSTLRAWRVMKTHTHAHTPREIFLFLFRFSFPFFCLLEELRPSPNSPPLSLPPLSFSSPLFFLLEMIFLR